MNIACFTVAAMDTFPQVNELHPGGNSLNQAVALRRLGHRTAFAGAVGMDAAGDAIEALLRKEQVDMTCLHRVSCATASNRIINDEAGERYGIEGAWDDGAYGAYRLSDADWAHLATCSVWCTHANSPDFGEALRRIRPGQHMAVDFLHRLQPDVLAACAGVADICYIGGSPDMIEPLAEIAAGRPGLIVLTLGAGGSIAFLGRDRHVQPALPLARVVDTTGCGDAFQAACTATWLETGDLAAALCAGAEHGRKAASRRGGVLLDD